jgi:tetratricopeptide (TPR) repeat protein
MNDRTTIVGANRAATPGQLFQLGLSLLQQKRFADAAAVLRQAHAALPDQPAIALKLGVALMYKGDLPQAREILSRVVVQLPDVVEAHGMLANVHGLSAQWEDAAQSFRRVIELSPNLPAAHFGLGSSLANLGKTTESISAFRNALRLNYPAAHCNLGVALLLTGQFKEAENELRAAIVFNPNDAVAHWNLALLLLLQGNWPQAWPEYEWRWQWNQFPSPRRNFRQPQWRGQKLPGQTLFLHAEQGFGDTLQFIRYLPLVRDACAKIVVECQPELLALLKSLPGNWHWIAQGEEPPAFDCHCPLASLPGIFETTPQNIPPQNPPPRPAQDRLEKWREKMGPPTGKPRIGIAWAGNSNFFGDRTRSLKLDQLRDILSLEKFQFISLQKGPAAEQIHEMGFAERLLDLGSQFNDFADTAAVMSMCDLILTTDTSVPHLAGAMGRPLWVMLQYVPDWRWLLDRDDSPWYPSARLFRQKTLYDWDEVIARVTQSLDSLQIAPAHPTEQPSN